VQPIDLMLSKLRKDGRSLASMMLWVREARPVVIAIPRRGVVVGVELARELGAPLDVLLVAKVGLGDGADPIGAVALGGARAVDARAIERLGLSRDTVDEAFAAATARLDARLAVIRADAPLPELEGRTVILVDDAVVSGLTMEAAVESLEARKIGALIVATPLVGEDAARRLSRRVRSWIALERTRSADAEARHLEDSNRICPPISDEELHEMLIGSWRQAHVDLGGLELDGI
jgi:putative phosphoribosyl transferase